MPLSCRIAPETETEMVGECTMPRRLRYASRRVPAQICQYSMLNDRDCELSEGRQYAGGTLLIGQGLYTSLSRLLRF